MQYRKARVYEGQWDQDMRNGRGMERYSNGNRYEGEFMNGKPHGKGVYTWANGEVYEGEWVNGLKEGQGIWKGIFGDSYIGEWRQSKATGYGVHQWKNGDKYEGEWFNCLKHGQGSDIFANGDIFSGTYRNGKPEGQGQYKWKNGSVYIGEFKNGLKNGRGKWRKRFNAQNCNMYEGQYENDKKNGMGQFTWESGNYYKGCYKDDERHGYGEMYWKDGSCYKGEWKGGIQHGVGRMQFPDGRVKEGLFENNTFKGPQAIQTPQIKQMKAQELMLNDTITNANGQQRLKSRGGSHPRSLTNNTQIIQLNNKIAGNTKPERGRTVTDNPFEIAVDQKAISFEQVNVKNFASAQKQEPASGTKLQLKRPQALNPVQDPKRRDHSVGGGSSCGEDINSVTGPNSIANLGYLSGGLQTDTESARLSNVQPYKYNALSKPPNPNQISIKKVSPNVIQLAPMAPPSREKV